MSYEIPDDRRYIDTHEWAKRTGEEVRVGISDFAQDELGDVVYVEFPEMGAPIDQEAPFGVVESIKAVSDLYAPVGGTVVATNDELLDAPELVNEDPYGEGWMIDIEPDDPDAIGDLMTADDYRDQIR